MSLRPQKGDRVKFRVGRGYAEGRVLNVFEDMITVATDAGKNLNRRLLAVEVIASAYPPAAPPVEPPAIGQPAPVEAAPAEPTVAEVG